MMDDVIRKTGGNMDPDQTFKKEELDLKTVRESKGLTLKEIFESTRISVVNLEAIEKGDFQVLPSPVFTKAFIKTYAKTIGIESNKILASYEQYLESLNDTSQKAEVTEEPTKTAQRQYKWFLWGLGILAGISIIVFSISSYKSDVDIPKTQIGQPVNPANEAKPVEGVGMTTGIKTESTAQMNPAAKPEENALQAKAASQAAPMNQETTGKPDIQQGATNQAAGETYRLILEAKELTWIRITADQNPPQEILLKPGERIDRSALSFTIDIGNAGGINIDFQGKSIGNLGKRGQVVHLTLP